MSERLSDRERAVVDGARAELLLTKAAPADAKSAAIPSSTGCSMPGSSTSDLPPNCGAPPPAPVVAVIPETAHNPDAIRAARIAAIMSAEREESMRRRAKTRLWGIYVPAGILAALIAWTAAKLLFRVLS